MCGIVGFVGREEAAPILLDGLARLEYRGYDSAGIAVYGEQEGLQVAKAKGRLQVLYELVEGGRTVHGTIGLGHTRWATHGEPSDVNSHPQVSESGRFAVVHNGIIENYMELREFLESEGVTFVSQTDTEVVAQLLEYYYDGDILATVGKVLGLIQGAYALGILSADCPDRLIAARKDSPLILGFGDGAHFLASDVTALIKYTRDVCYLDDGEIAELTADHLWVYDAYLRPVEKEHHHVDWEISAAEKGGYEHFMAKEIMEQPEAFRKTISPRILQGKVALDGLSLEADYLREMDKLYVIACGSSYHVGMVAKYTLERLLRKPVEVTLASEFRYCDPIVTDKTLALVISQSGETVDTLAAMREARRLGARVLSIVNVVGSTIARESDDVLYTWAGPEIAVATTKAYQGLLHPAGGGVPHRPVLRRQAGHPAPGGIRRHPGGAADHPRQAGADSGQPGGHPVFRLPLLQPPLHLLHRPQRGLRHRHGGLSEAEGDLLHPLRGLRRRRAEARHHLPHRAGHPGGGPGQLRQAL